MNQKKENQKRKKILLYSVLICSVIVPSIALAIIMQLSLLETILVLFFPLLVLGILYASILIFGFGFYGLNHFVSLSLDTSTSIPMERDRPLAFYSASLIINFIFFTLLVFLSPQETLAIFPIFSSEQLTELIKDLFTNANISQSIEILLGFIIFPIISSLTLVGMRFYRSYFYTYHSVKLENANSAGQKLVDSLKILFYVSLVLLVVSIYLGRFPSGYSLGDYCFWLFLIIIPGSILGAWLSQRMLLTYESANDDKVRKLATLRIASWFLRSDSILYEVPVVVELDYNEWEALDRLRIPTKPKNWEGKRDQIRTFEVDAKDVLKQEKKILSFTKDRIALSIEKIGPTTFEESIKHFEKARKYLEKARKRLEKSSENS